VRRAALLLAAAALAAPALAHGDDGPRVVVRDEGGDVVAEAALPADGRFALAYRHSVYQAPAEERFRADGQGFVLDSIASPNQRVLDYYELDGDRTREGETWVLRPYEPARFNTMPLAATRRGQRTLVTSSERVPLYGGPVHLRLVVNR
jgi:hypothetical protein